MRFWKQLFNPSNNLVGIAYKFLRFSGVYFSPLLRYNLSYAWY